MLLLLLLDVDGYHDAFSDRQAMAFLWRRWLLPSTRRQRFALEVSLQAGVAQESLQSQYGKNGNSLESLHNHLHQYLLHLNIQDNQNGLITHPCSTEWSKQRVVPFHKKKLYNFCNHFNSTSNVLKTMTKFHLFQLIKIAQLRIPKNNTTPSVKLIFMQFVQPMLTPFAPWPQLICMGSEVSFQLISGTEYLRGVRF